MARISAGVALVALLGLGLGCGADQRVCEHARDVFMDRAQVQLDAAIRGASPEQRANLEALGPAEIKRGREVFVAECLALEAAERACMRRIDDFVAADERRQAAVDACARDLAGSPDRACSERAEAAAMEALGECFDPMFVLTERVWQRAAVAE